MHHGTPQDMESDPDDEVKQILHHHMELLLLCCPFCWLCCRFCTRYVSVQYFCVRDASDRTLFFRPLHHCWSNPLVVHEWKWKWFKLARVYLLLSSSQVQWSRMLCHTSACFPSPVLFLIHAQQNITMSPYLLLTHRKFHSGLLWLFWSWNQRSFTVCLLIFPSIWGFPFPPLLLACV